MFIFLMKFGRLVCDEVHLLDVWKICCFHLVTCKCGIIAPNLWYSSFRSHGGTFERYIIMINIAKLLYVSLCNVMLVFWRSNFDRNYY
jgi:hypothetical protein